MNGSFKAFWKGYSYNIVKMFINQFAIAMFGLTLAIATGKSGNAKLELICSIFAVLFYLFLIYTMTWDVGATDKVRVDAGRAKASPLRGLYMSLIANIPNFILAVLICVSYPFAATQEWAGNTCAISKFIALLLEGMYTGLLSLEVGGTQLNALPWMYLVITLPALLTSMLSYLAGLHDFRIMGLFGLNYTLTGPADSHKPKK
ncbi:MAG: hypothetical protein IJX53_05465 [Clostridia bacterium]|nr:hypothetical protein [Clostridia bacterium]